jgi:hypothetical protein
MKSSLSGEAIESMANYYVPWVFEPEKESGY